jgi:hypothetical protein
MPNLPQGWRYVEPEQQPFDLNAAPPLPGYAPPPREYEPPPPVWQQYTQPSQLPYPYNTAPGPDPVRDIVGTAKAFGAGVLSGATFNFDDEILGFLVGAWPNGPTVSEATEQQRQRQERAREELPWMNTAGQVVGGGLTGYGAFRTGLSPLSGARPTYSSIVPRAAAEGAGYGAVAGAGAGETGAERGTGAAIGGITGGVGGMAGGVLGQTASRFARNSPYRTAPTGDELRTQYQTFRQQARQIGLQLEDKNYIDAARDIERAFRADFAPDLAPQTFARVQQLMDLPSNPTLEDVEVVRRLLSTIARNTSDPTERAAAISVRGGLDDYLSNLQAADVLAGDPQAATDLMREARNVYRRLATSEFVEETISGALLTAQARGTPAGGAMAIRNAFANLLKNERAMRRFNDVERGLIEDIAKSNTAESILQALGGFSLEAIFTNPLRTMLTLGASGAAGYIAGGPVGAATLPLLATASGRAARGMASEEANLLSAVIRSGQAPTTPPLVGMTTAAGARAPIAAPGAQELIEYLAPPEDLELPAGWRLIEGRASPPTR